MKDFFSKYVVEQWWVPILLTIGIGITFVVVFFGFWIGMWGYAFLILFAIATLCVFALSCFHFYHRRRMAGFACLAFSGGAVACILMFLAMMYVVTAG